MYFGIDLGLIAGVAGLGYVLGSVPWGLLLTAMAGMGDIRSVGSGNIGATNVLRTGNKFIAALTLLFDVGKGVAAVFAGAYLAPSVETAEIYMCVGGGAAYMGHVYPVWLKFKGGKGVATFGGVLLAVDWQVGLAIALIWLLVAVVLRYSSLAALVAGAASPVLAFFMAGSMPLVVLTLLMTVFVFIRHAANIQRLVAGEEPRIGGTREKTE